jgi:NAD(P)-dependent dehydrogenase (short-subunit alcohol dehydrogenase family)
MKHAIVTGASGNLGQSVVKRFIEGGYRVTGTVLANDLVSFDHPPGLFERAVVDLLQEDESGQFVEKIISEYGTIDTAVLTVGGFAMGNIADTSAADILKQYRLNFETTYHIARPVFQQMIKQNSGRIFIIGSRPGLAAWHGSGMIAYSLAKSLLVRLAELMNGEAKGKNVVTSVVVPSTIDTPQNRKAMPDAPFHDWVKPQDIANVIYYHSSEEAKTLRETLIKVYNNA